VFDVKLSLKTWKYEKGKGSYWKKNYPKIGMNTVDYHMK
jgi:hypothetical protein